MDVCGGEKVCVCVCGGEGSCAWVCEVEGSAVCGGGLFLFSSALEARAEGLDRVHVCNLGIYNSD